jgi:phosphatidylserine decarboxylase
MSPLEPVPFALPQQLDPLVVELRDNILPYVELLEVAVQQALRSNVAQMAAWNITSAEGFLRYASGMLRWVPSENFQGKSIYVVLTMFGFIFDQPALQDLQTSIHPDSIGESPTPLSDWLVRYAKALGTWMDTPDSLTAASFITFGLSPAYNLHEAETPAGGFKTFNELFARRLKPGARPINRPDDDRSIVHAADSTFGGSWRIESNNEVTIKSLPWSIGALLDGSDYAPRYKGGIWMHSFLNTFGTLLLNTKSIWDRCDVNLKYSWVLILT